MDQDMEQQWSKERHSLRVDVEGAADKAESPMDSALPAPAIVNANNMQEEHLRGSSSSREAKDNVNPAARSSEPATGGPGAVHGTDLTGIFKQVAVRDAVQQLPRKLPAKEKEQTANSGRTLHATDVFSTLSGPPKSEEPGFTQMFQALGTNNSSPHDSLPRDRNNVSESDGFFADRPKGHPVPEWPESSDPGASRPAPSYGAGGFTQLFRKLDHESESPEITQQERFAAEAGQTPQPGGGFTQLLRTLSSESDAGLPTDHPSPMVQPPPEGPGEFTRIVSRSALRDAASRREHENVKAQDESFAPEMQAQPQRSAINPNRSASDPQYLSNSQPMLAPLPLEQSEQVATAPRSAGATASPHQPLGKLQQYIPVLLIANFFTMFIVLVLLVFILLRHR
ncbi:hypothetical protein [Acidisarcina polymorpha]|nr:hypothetical protein [Acidisarcina polymorpha]